MRYLNLEGWGRSRFAGFPLADPAPIRGRGRSLVAHHVISPSGVPGGYLKDGAGIPLQHPPRNTTRALGPSFPHGLLPLFLSPSLGPACQHGGPRKYIPCVWLYMNIISAGPGGNISSDGAVKEFPPQDLDLHRTNVGASLGARSPGSRQREHPWGPRQGCAMIRVAYGLFPSALSTMW